MAFKNTIIFDFDGVINSYASGWKGIDCIPDPPVEGIKETIEKLREKYKIVVVSTRCNEEEGIKAIKEYLNFWGIIVDDVVKEKPPAVLTVDDRCICFDGNCSTLIDKIENFKNWVEKENK